MLIREPMIAKKQESKGDEKKIYYELNNYRIFDFIEPEIHPLYVLSAEPEVEIFDNIVNNFLGKYCIEKSDLRSLKDNCSIGDKNTSYLNKHALMFLYGSGRVYFSTNDYHQCRKKKYLNEIHNPKEVNNDELIQKAEKFIENYLGGFRKDLKPEIKTGNEIIFHQFIDGVKISQAAHEAGVTIEYYKNNIIKFVRFTFNIEKHELISRKILSPVECIEKSKEFFINYNRDQWIKFTEVSLAYFPRYYLDNGSEKFTMIPVWEFTNQDHTDVIYLNVFSGEVVHYWLGMF